MVSTAIEWSGSLDLFKESLELHREIKQIIFDKMQANMDVKDLKETEEFLCEREKVMLESFILTGLVRGNGGQTYFIK